ncbi:winged helix-turn-helix transcriptional regulator [Alkalibacter rhizosphaerae]|uniref:Winged helix-turn-helix transcriptional regulator n=1 Tax=Alkalibacter rhizosphaerae TaxID=2815577 RepID=A0A974XGJ5_9FIRM|nr:metalloregulator ArsR/SmtB family transcription factor [Alkalibacter rhizosphaerae]QSX09403.1 winged helix-turn-helix transcriptional regulator [Alkalibacter rhizosphaerae]
MDHEGLSKILKGLSDPHRIKIVEILSCGERCACEILPHFTFTQPTLSHHMKVLMDCGLVNVRKEGTWSHYSLNEKEWTTLVEMLSLLGSSTGDCICLEENPLGCKKS